MATETLSAALEREHRDIDGGIESFAEGVAGGKNEADTLLRALAALRRHIYLEEAFLFPPLRDAGMTMPIFVMEREHGQLWDTMGILEDELAGAGADQDKLVKTCTELLAQLDRHNSKEEPIIYPQADTALNHEATAELGSFLESGQMPVGWVCSRAGG